MRAASLPTEGNSTEGEHGKQLGGNQRSTIQIGGICNAVRCSKGAGNARRSRELHWVAANLPPNGRKKGDGAPRLRQGATVAPRMRPTEGRRRTASQTHGKHSTKWQLLGTIKPTTLGTQGSLARTELTGNAYLDGDCSCTPRPSFHSFASSQYLRYLSISPRWSSSEGRRIRTPRSTLP